MSVARLAGSPPCLLGSIHQPRDAQDHILVNDILDYSEPVRAVAVEQVYRLVITEELVV
jgi:hypothetical protein